MTPARTGEIKYDTGTLPTRTASEYFQQNCWVGVAGPSPGDVDSRYEIGIDRMMWGSDYPHDEGTHPYTKEHLRQRFAAMDPGEVRKILAGNAAELYDFDLAALQPLADEWGMTPEELHTPLDGARRARPGRSSATTWTPAPSERRRLRSMVDGDTLREALRTGPILALGVWDPLTTLVARQAGFDTVFVSGFAVAGTLLGRPDVGVLTQTETADVARRVCSAAPGTAVLVDADTGYGDAVNAARTAELWTAAGAAGMFLEDQDWPKRCGHMDGKRIVPVEDWLAKLAAVRRESPGLFLTARTDAAAPEGLDEALERARAAADQGVDALFVEAPGGVDALETVAAALGDRGPTLVTTMVERPGSPDLAADELHAMGYGLVVAPVALLFAATRAMTETATVVRAVGTTTPTASTSPATTSSPVWSATRADPASRRRSSPSRRSRPWRRSDRPPRPPDRRRRRTRAAWPGW